MNKKKVLIIFGTRPEAIKMAPLIKEFQNKKKIFETKVCITAQHREMLDQVLEFFQISVNFDLDIMKQNQNLYTLTSSIILDMKTVLENFQPDYIFVHGDTTTSMAAGLAGFYYKTKICHIEAGLRSQNKFSPYPEEMNRLITSKLADFHFAPTDTARQNLIDEKIDSDKIIITGNTVIDALFLCLKKIKDKPTQEIENLEKKFNTSNKIILVTAHRRESYGTGFKNICKALIQISDLHKDCTIVYPVHLNPNVKEIVFKNLSGINNIHLIEPLSYSSFVWLMNKCKIILTDSGGIQEEAPALGKPVIVLRNVTERKEAIDCGTAILTGTDSSKIVEVVDNLLEDKKLYDKMSTTKNPYGDGCSSKKIVNFLIDLENA